MTAPMVQIASEPIDFGPGVTLDPTSFVVFTGNDADVDLSGGEWVDVPDVARRDWNDDTVSFRAVWSTKPGETED